MRLSGIPILLAAAAVTFGVLAGAGASSPSATDTRVQQDRCVRGEWRMSTSASNALLQSLIPLANIRVTQGVMTAAFPRNGRMLYGSTHFVVKLTAGPLTMTGTADFSFEASWQTGNGKLILDAGRSYLYISKFSATKDGKTVTVAGPPPTVRRVSGDATPYTCRGDRLRWKIPLNDTWVTFRRAR